MKNEANFGSARIGSAAEFTGAEFKGDADFVSARIGSIALFNGAEFKELTSFNRAQIEESAFFNSATFGDEANFVSARIGSAAVFTGAEFKKGVSFNAVQIEGAAFFNPATFGDEANFGSARIGGTAEFTGVVFKQQASFNGAQIEESALFNPATFKGEANFGSARIGSNAEFTGAEFKQQVSFNGAQIEESAFFNPAYLFSWDNVPGNDNEKLLRFLRDVFDIGWAGNAEIGKYDDGKTIRIFKDEYSAEIMVAEEKATLKFSDGRTHELKVKNENGKLNIFNQATFEGEAYFISARIGSAAVFTGAEFKELASFNGAQIETAFFNQATFEGEANFISARIGSTAEFTGATFKQRAIFSRVQIEESAFFNPAIFEGEANFGSARIGSAAVFNGAEFKELASFNGVQIETAFFNLAIFEGEANFISARIGSAAVFMGAKFKQLAYFNSAQIERESHFEETIFDNNVSFQDTSLKTVFWGEPNVQFIKKVDLRGCIYDRIHPLSFWKQLMKHIGPYDRQPFTQLEETFRWAGKDKLADDVYYERKCREFTENITIRKPGAWLLDRFLCIFHLEGAVKLDIQLPSMMSSQVTLPWWEAFWVSLNTFLPIEIPSGADWKPSSLIIPVFGIKFTTFATVLNLAGWILVPVGVAGIAGLLKRSK
jgi:uncharacterized protein YjbI with pentapeptide repeats